MNEALIKKLRVPADGRVLILQPPDGYLSELGLEDTATVYEDTLNGSYDFVQLFVSSVKEVEAEGPIALRAIRPDGLLWLCYPKGKSRLTTDLNRDHGWEIIRSAGFEAVSQVSVDETWSALRFRPLTATTRRSDTSSVPTERKRELKRAAAAELPVPDDLQEALEKNGAAQELFMTLAPSHRKAYITWITEAKREETRTSRIALTVEKIELGWKNPYNKG